MVGVHAGQVPHRVPDVELDHADHAPKAETRDKIRYPTQDIQHYSLSVLLAAIEGAGGQVLYEANPLGDLDLNTHTQ